MLSHKSATLQQMPTIQISVILDSLNYISHYFMVCWSTFQINYIVLMCFKNVQRFSLKLHEVCINSMYHIIKLIKNNRNGVQQY